MRKLAMYIQWCSILILLLGPARYATAQKLRARQSNAALVNSFYSSQGSSLFWYQPDGAHDDLRKQILSIADGALYYGLQKEKYNFPKEIAANAPEEEWIRADKQYSEALVNFAIDLYTGANIERHLKNDEISAMYRIQTDSFLLWWLRNIQYSKDIPEYFSLLEPDDNPYHILKQELKLQIDSGNRKTIPQLSEAINIYRWIAHFRFNKYIIVNIPSATLGLYTSDTEELKMSVVVGKPSTRTPRFSSWCDKVILYPYWNVPGSIARKELLPSFKKSPQKVGAMNMQILNSRGKIVDPYSLQWSTFSRSYFPYTIRQCTGCENALGVIKFNLTDPFNVYMHDTNYKLAFLSAQRYFSHGCIRVSQPIELGNALLDNKLDSNFLKACYKNQEPIILNLKNPVPVFVVYLTAVPEAGNVKYYRDVYHLIR